MTDWKKLARQRLSASGLSDEETTSELAAHLEDEYEHARSDSRDEESAMEIALQEIEDWDVIARKIRLAKEGSVNHRTRSLWIPALFNLWGASAVLALVESMRIGPHLVWVGNWAITVYWAWLATLPAFGALAAYLSQCAKSTPRVRLVAALAPAVVMLIVMSLILPWGMLIDGFSLFRLVGFGLGLINWVGFPGTALLAGAAPFLRHQGEEEIASC